MNDRIYKKPLKPDYMVDLARRLRREESPAEALLWEHLRNRKFRGLKFRRQVPFGRAVLDFWCKEEMLAIEVDGTSHVGQESYDRWREEFLGGCKVWTVRFTNNEVTGDMARVLETLESVCRTLTART
jgi:very-short-patch-repair endonuclease